MSEPGSTPAAEPPDLGALVRVYRASSLKQLGLTLFSLLFVCFGVADLLGYAPCFPGSAFFVVVRVVVGVLLIVLGLFGLWGAVFYLGRLRVRLCEDGFVFTDGRSVRSVLWGDIDRVHLTETEHTRNGRIEGYSHRFEVFLKYGGVIELNDTEIGGGEELGRAIMREVQRHELKQMLKAALEMETAGWREEAIAAFEALIQKSPYNEIAEQARKRIQQIRQTMSPPGEDR